MGGKWLLHGLEMTQDYLGSPSAVLQVFITKQVLITLQESSAYVWLFTGCDPNIQSKVYIMYMVDGTIENRFERANTATCHRAAFQSVYMLVIP